MWPFIASVGMKKLSKKLMTDLSANNSSFIKKKAFSSMVAPHADFDLKLMLLSSGYPLL